MRDSEGEALQPSIVAFHPNGSVIIGREAKRRRLIDPANTIYSVKAHHRSPVPGPRGGGRAATRVPYTIRQGPNEQPIIHTRAGKFGGARDLGDGPEPPAQNRLAEPRGRGAPGGHHCPGKLQRRTTSGATATAGAIAGLRVPHVVNEPTAAAIAYGHGRNLRESHRRLRLWRGGTFDMTLLRLDGNLFEVLGTAGDSFLGGDDIDERLVDAMLESFLANHRIDLRADALAMQRLRSGS